MPSEATLLSEAETKHSEAPQLGLGLALSGGGFRAAFFHLGALARLAETDLLRHVEMISTVSGGSILGAAYYLKLQALLESKPDAEVTTADYVRLISELEHWFLARVQSNIRMRAFRNPWSNIKDAFKMSFTRSDCLAELYGKVLYRPLFNQVLEVRARREPERASEILARRRGRVRMSDLLVQPLGSPPSFSPLKDNAGRRAKVPVLVINASTLNTGRRWQFTAKWMGEQFGAMQAASEEADVNAVLEGLYYSDAADSKYEQFPLDVAVAASACVPGLFPPLPLSGLFEDWWPQLVDGGVHDNQGISPLIQNNCQTILVSDGSGLMRDETNPKPFPLAVVARSNSVLQDRIRDLSVASIRARPKHFRGAVVHLRDGLCASHVLPKVKQPVASAAPRTGSETRYRIAEPFQQALSRVRTDLDAFSDVEADALMGSAYLISKTKLEDFRSAAVTPIEGGFRFKWILPRLENASKERKLLRLLQLAEERLFKGALLWIPKQVIQALLVAFATVGIIIWLMHKGDHGHQLTWTNRQASAAVLGVGLLTGLVALWARARKALSGLFILLAVTLPANLQIYTANKLFLWAGARKRFGGR